MAVDTSGTYFIELAKKDMKAHVKNLPDADLAYLREGSAHFDDYVFAVEWVLQLTPVATALSLFVVLMAVAIAL
jgi:tRNA-splicing ligase RtcB